MKTVILTSGPRGSGKSSFVKKIIEENPHVKHLNRDEFYIKEFGSTSLDPYGGSQIAAEMFRDHLKIFMKQITEGKIILDCWNGFYRDRQYLINLLLECNVDKVFCWQFVTPLNVCMKWFFQKEDSKGYSESGYRRDYNLYHEKATNIDENGFSSVIRINPLQLTIPGMSLV